MGKTLRIVVASCVVLVAVVSLVATPNARAGRGDGPIIYVTSQELFYDSIVTTDLPRRGPFQKLETDGPPPNGLQTAFGPGDPGYRGGRWWVDVNGDNEMDDGDDYFSCPLLGPGREEP